MTTDTGITVDPWLKNTAFDATIPDDAEFVCGYENDMGIASMDEVAFIERTADRDILWIAFDLRLQLPTAAAGQPVTAKSAPDLAAELRPAVSRPRDGDTLAACQGLLDILFRARVGFSWPSTFLVEGVVTRQDFDRVVGAMKDELDANTAKAKRSETAIVTTARKLELFPTPTGKSPDRWRATCPRTNHHIEINATRNEFFCGWCKRSGGPDALRDFAAQRRYKPT